MANVTMDGKNFLIKKIGDDYYAISGGRTIAVGPVRKDVKAAALSYVTPKLYAKNKVDIGLLSPIEISAMIENGQLRRSEVEKYFNENYAEDIEELKAAVRHSLNQFNSMVAYNPNMVLEKSPSWIKMNRKAVEDFGSETFYNLMKYIIQPQIEEMNRLSKKSVAEIVRKLKREA